MSLPTPISLENHSVGVYKSNPFVSQIMSVYVISCYVDIASISKHSPGKKIAARSFSTLLAIYTPVLLKKFLQEALKFYF